MKASDVEKALKKHGALMLRQKGSHRRWVSACGKCFTTVPVHPGEDIKTGTAAGIRRDMEPCLGKGWLTGA